MLALGAGGRGQGEELAWVECTHPLIIADSKQPVFLCLFSPSDGERVQFGFRRKVREDEKEKGLKMDKNCHPYFWW